MGLATAERMLLYAADPANAPASAPPASAYASPIREPEISREALIKLLADHFGFRPYEQMAEDKSDLRGKIRDGYDYDINEPTRSHLSETADAILNLAPVGGRGEGWRPISEAPRDGTRVDLWHTEHGREPDCYWGLPEHTCGEAGQYCDSDWHSLQPGWVNGLLNQPVSNGQLSHFRLVPPPPQDQGGMK